MERRVIKLPSGYLNVDKAAITFTRSGNWSEAAMVVERRGRVHLGHLVRVALGIAMVGTGMVFYSLISLHLKGGIAFAIAAAGAAWSIYKYINRLKDDMARPFRIPFAKVRALHASEGALIIAFINGKWKEDEVRIKLDVEQARWVVSIWEAHRAK
jgi:hypothetical protein